ncbi:MAG: 50S ribosomal protein L22 [Micavibrio sp.]
MAMAKFLRTSPGKLNLVATMIRGKKADRALTDLEFSNRRIAKDVRKVLASAVANAENNHNLDVDKLVVAEAYVGKSVKMRRFTPRARGRAAAIEKHFSRLTIVVREGEAVKTLPKKPAAKKAPASKPENAEKTAKPAAKKEAAKKPAAKKKAAGQQDKE